MAQKKLVTWDRRAIRKLTGEGTQVVSRRAAIRVRDRARDNVTAAGRVNTGAMRDSIRVYPVYSHPEASSFEVGSVLPYTNYQEFGIGPVFPVTAQVLRFKPKGSGVFVFAAYTRGFKGAHFMRKAWRSITVRDFLP